MIITKVTIWYCFILLIITFILIFLHDLEWIAFNLDYQNDLFQIPQPKNQTFLHYYCYYFIIDTYLRKFKIRIVVTIIIENVIISEEKFNTNIKAIALRFLILKTSFKKYTFAILVNNFIELYFISDIYFCLLIWDLKKKFPLLPINLYLHYC